MAEQRDQALLAVGKQCSHTSCGLVDFLPFKCQHCEQPYCQEHFLAKDHQCAKYDERQHNRIAPHCPLCNEPVAIPPGQDPNVRMDRHITAECVLVTGKEKQKTVPTCERAKCGKTLYQPIRCDKCRKQFCPSHRFPSDHSCSPLPPSASSRLMNLSAPKVNTRAINTQISSASQAVKNKVDSLQKPALPKASASTPNLSASKPSLPGPFSKTDSPSSASSPPSASQSSRDAVNDANNTPQSESPIRRNPYMPPPIFGFA
ncbi:hypothetical protein CYLTODRAFT_425179 [Cylindrobasidium torrendii FP15055 ss-10]|uniref:AN1-type domain-containing protein n=1 Tax=Cylindrobasidium torrendii FP15055 ss-10 TaxID=1314674 RepID=A0A0D7B4M4_9AGAR|nr:hypothetical protein CYLTODRAFT_425179 [Cylindrobasidium torrendii FP15055 ss-10]